MKIIVACFLRLEELPPAITLLKELSKEHEIVYLGVDEPSDYHKKLFNDNVRIKRVVPLQYEKGKTFFEKVKKKMGWIMKDYLYARATNAILEEYNEKDGDLVWILHEYTLMHLNSKIERIPFNLTMYELHTDIFKKESMLKQRARLAKKIIVPEYSRSAIVQACVGLPTLPYVVPNKPYEFSEEEIYLEDNPMKAFAEDAHKQGKKVILYSGIFLRERKLDTIIEAALKSPEKYTVAFIGRMSDYLEELLAKYDNAHYLGFVLPPKHLSMVKYVDIGVLTYVADSGSINPVFCAPNKIWEYAKYGVPMICNDIPGLKYTVEYNGFGYCCDIENVDDIAEKLDLICDNFEELSKNAVEYYYGADIGAMITKILND